MAAEERKERQEEMDAPFPKNIKQMGSVDPQCRIYMEDYVYTYLNKLAQPGNLYARGARRASRGIGGPNGTRCPDRVSLHLWRH